MTDTHSVEHDIAIIGMAGRFPGANTIEVFWEHLRDGVESISAFTDAELRAMQVAEQAIRASNYVKAGSILTDVDRFDAAFFGYTPREAELMDPQHRIFLECAWEALERAGYPPQSFDGLIGVYAGTSLSTYLLFNLLTHPSLRAAEDTFPLMVGNDKDFVSTRVSYNLNLKGPSIDVQTGCSTSLVAAHLACDSLLSYQCDLALAGGISVDVPQRSGYFYQAGGITSPDGHCRAFDADAQGTVFGSGVGIVVLRRLADALDAGDPIYAVIKGSAINNDGALKVGYTAPSVDGQAEVIARAQALAGIDPETIDYIEAHGTGTALGDPVEVAALTKAFRAATKARQFCGIGSVKSNIGHLDAAAGIAGLIKTALALQHRQMPPTLHFCTPNPQIDFASSPFYVNATLKLWGSNGHPRRAGINSFGIGGTNAHMILEEPPDVEGSAPARPWQVLPLSAKTAAALERMKADLADFLAAHPQPNLADVAYTLQIGRQPFEHRCAVICSSTGDAIAALRNPASDRSIAGTADSQRAVAFLFPGQGAQYVQMAAGVYQHEPAFRETFDRCAELLRTHLGLDLREALYPAGLRMEDGGWRMEDRESSILHPPSSILDQTQYAQPALFVVEYALARLWMAWGVQPQAMSGHSIGEYVAACLAGVFSLEEALALVAARGRMIQELPGGAMLAVPLSEREVLPLLGPDLSLAAINGSAECVVSGLAAAIEVLQRRLQADDIAFRRLHTSHAFHSAAVESIVDRYTQEVARVTLRAPQIPYISNLTGTWITAGQATSPSYWAQHLRQTVRFADGLNLLLETPSQVLLEVGPGRTLGNLARQQPGFSAKQIVLPSLRHARDEQSDASVLLKAAASLWCAGVPIAWQQLSAGERRRRVLLPTYPFERQRYWIEPADDRQGRVFLEPAVLDPAAHPLLGQHLEASTPIIIFAAQIQPDAPAYLADHRIHGTIMLPATAYVEMGLQAAGHVFEQTCLLERFAIREALILLEGEARSVQTHIVPEIAGRFSFSIYSRSAAASQPGGWTLHATGLLQRSRPDTPAPTSIPRPFAAIQARCGEQVDGPAFYERMAELNIQLGSAFQGVEQLWRRDGEALGRIRLRGEVADQAARYRIHPALLDACVQVVAAALPRAQATASHSFLPSGCGSVRVYQPPGTDVFSHVVLRSGDDPSAETVAADICLYDAAGELLVELLGWSLRRVRPSRTGQGAQPGDQDALGDWLYQVAWRRAEPPASTPAPPGTWLIFTDRSGVGQELAARLEAQGDRCILVGYRLDGAAADGAQQSVDPSRPDELRQLIDRYPRTVPPCRGAVHLWSLDITADETTGMAIEQGQMLNCTSVLHLVQALVEAGLNEALRLWLVTCGAQNVGGEEVMACAQAPLWGLGRVIALEHAELRCTRIDLAHAAPEAQIDQLLCELRAEYHEDQVALRGADRYVPRLVQYTPASNQPDGLEDARKLAIPRTAAFGLAMPAAGSLHDLALLPIERPAPGTGQIAIQVQAAGLNFVDLLKAMALYPGAGEPPFVLGSECAGTIVAVGAGVEGFQVGDAVVAIAPASASSYVVTPAHLATHKPAHLGFDQAASIPLAFMTAYYALHHLGQLARGKRVLIHSAAGGVGLAAVQVAQWLGADIFATVGNAEKQALLRSLGVAHVLDSRSLSFADEIMQITAGRGVDVVLNSLSGEAIERSLAIISPFGRFVDISKTDIYNNSPLGLYPFHKALSYFAVDLELIFRHQPELAQSLLRDVVERVGDGTFKLPPIQVFAVEEALKPLLLMSQRKNIGKLVLKLPGPAEQPRASETLFSADATYMITGGLGELGLCVAQWMVERGARHLALVGRHGAGEAASRQLAALEQQGAAVAVMPADVADDRQIGAVLARIAATMPSLRGVIHTAGVLDDAPLLHLDQRRFADVMAPKVKGAWNLHTLTRDTALDFMVLFSSASSVFGASGQGNYAAANAFLEALASQRAAQGLPVLCINWGPWAEIGMAARAYRDLKHLANAEVPMIPPGRGLAILEQLLGERHTQMIVLPYKPWELLQYAPQAAGIPMFSELVRDDLDLGQAAAATLHPRPTMATEYVAPRSEIERRVAGIWQAVIGIAPVGIHDSFFDLGGSSLLAIQVISLLNKEFKVQIPVTSLFEGGTVSSLAKVILEDKQLTQAFEASQNRGEERRARARRSVVENR